MHRNIYIYIVYSYVYVRYVYVRVIFLCVLYINAGKLVFYALAQKLIGRQMHNALTYKHI